MTETKRVIYYYQTFTGIDQIIALEDVVTHIHISSIHFGLTKNQRYIHLNDNSPYDSIFNTVWNQLATYKKVCKGKVILMIGGAGGGFSTLFSDFETYYNLLKTLIYKKKDIIDGIDLDVEEDIGYSNIKRLISRLKFDFGMDFIVTMAPVQFALQTDEPGMGGFSYKTLYKDIGHFIDYFNGQFYGDYSEDAYTQVIENGYPPEKIVLGSLSGNYNKHYSTVVENLAKKYPNFGGVFNWEYFDAPPNPNNPAIWALMMKNYMGK